MSDGSQYFKGLKIITKAVLLSRLHMEFYRHRVKVGKKLLSCAYNIFQGMGIGQGFQWFSPKPPTNGLNQGLNQWF